MAWINGEPGDESGEFPTRRRGWQRVCRRGGRRGGCVGRSCGSKDRV